jgi:hypothetical protein
MNVNASRVRDRNTAHRRRLRRAAPMIGVLSIALLASACSSGSSVSSRSRGTARLAKEVCW